MLLALLPALATSAQVGIKTNAIYGALATANIGGELAVAPKWSLEVTGNLNAWSTSGEKKWKHWMIQPGARYWFCNHFAGHFVGIHAHGGQYNIGGLHNGIRFLGTDFSKLSDSRYQGWFIGAGISYGYAWILGRHWNLEAEIGVGYSYTRFDRYPCAVCGDKIESRRPHNYIGPTKVALNLVYVF